MKRTPKFGRINTIAHFSIFISQFLLFSFKLFKEMDFNWCQFILCPLLELIVFRIGLGFGQLCRNLACMSQNVLSGL